ncbi:MAG: hypothetical protein WCF23_17190 [Candidatus Nitrosopolaris sp.]
MVTSPIIALVLALIIPTTNVFGHTCNDQNKCYNDGWNIGHSNAVNNLSPANACESHTDTWCNGYNNGWAAGDGSVGNTQQSSPQTQSSDGGSPKTGLKDKFCNFVQSRDGAAASALATLLGYSTVVAAAQAICV